MRFRALAATLLTALSLAATPALADTSVGGGVFFPSDGGTTGGLLGSYGIASLPVAPLSVQVSGAVPFGPGGRFAATVEGVFHTSEFFVGAGAGGGHLRQINGTTGAVYDLLAGVNVAHDITLHARYYGSGDSNVGSATYLGLFFRVK